jgi:hypothetical protein
MRRRLAVSGKCQHVGVLVALVHGLQRGLESFSNLAARRTRQARTVTAIESALAIDTVESAYLAVAWHQIDTKRQAQPTAMHRSEDGRRIDYSTHILSAKLRLSKQKANRGFAFSITRVAVDFLHEPCNYSLKAVYQPVR